MWIQNDSYSWWWDLLRILVVFVPWATSNFQPGPPELVLLEDHLRQLQVIKTDMWLITSGEIKSKSGHTWETWKTTQQNTTYFGWQKFYGNGPASGWPFPVYHSHLTVFPRPRCRHQMVTGNRIEGWWFLVFLFWRQDYLNIFRYVDSNIHI